MSTQRAPLADGMPMLGYGTGGKTGEECTEAVADALELGYRHLDTATHYENEAAVGAGVDAADVDEAEVFVATKLWGHQLGYADVVTVANQSRARLEVEAIDLLYVHWPRGDYDAQDTIGAFDQLVDDGVTRRVGVSNFTVELLREALSASSHGIFANQVECHPLLPQERLREFCAGRNVELVAYAPLARGAVFEVPEITAVAERHDATEAQVSLAWLREKGVTTIPSGTGPHVRENWASLDVELTDEDVARIDGIERRHRCVDPDDAPWNRPGE